VKKKRDWLKKIRKELSLSQTDVAKELNISRSHYACIENGIRNPSMKLAERISELLKFDFSRFKNSLL